MKQAGRIITFYSYKGGVGRSFALANVAAIFALWECKVLCVDWDLEAPGLHHFFPQLVRKRKSGIPHLVESATQARKRAWKSCINTATIGATGKTIDLILAGHDTVEYPKRVHALDWHALYKKHRLGEFLERLRQEWARDYDFILIDSRTGLTDIGGICTIHLPDVVVEVFTANRQSLDGTAFMARRIQEERAEFFFSSGQAIIFPLLSRWEEKDAPEDAKRWLREVIKTVRPSYDTWRNKDAKVERLVELLKIPYKAKWNFGEALAVLEESATDPGSVSYHLHLIAGVLARDFADTHLLVGEPDRYVDDARAAAPMKRNRLILPEQSETPQTHGVAEPMRLERATPAQSFDLLAGLTRKWELALARKARPSELDAIRADLNEQRRAVGLPLLESETPIKLGARRASVVPDAKRKRRAE